MQPMIDRRDRELLLCFILKCARADLTLNKKTTLTPTERKKLLALEKKRATGWPIQYLMGTAWFYGRQFQVTPAVLIPRPETELLVEKILETTRAEKSASKKTTRIIMDIGTGSGCIAISLAQNLNTKIIAVDNSGRALNVARANAKKLLRQNASIKFFKSNLLANFSWPRAKKIIIAANLPYLSARRLKTISREVRHEPDGALAAGYDGLVLYKKLFQQIAARACHKQSVIIFAEIDPEQKTKLAALARRELPNATTDFFPDLRGNIRCAKIIFSL